MTRPTTPERFFSQLTREPSGCWNWTGYIHTLGYGEVCVRRRKLRAHRYAYELAWGPIPAGMVVMHTCDNPICCNPNHLKAGTQRENLLDKLRKGRQPRRYNSMGKGYQGKNRRARGVCIHGHELIGENLYITKDGRRRCRTCHHRHVREYAERLGART